MGVEGVGGTQAPPPVAPVRPKTATAPPAERPPAAPAAEAQPAGSTYDPAAVRGKQHEIGTEFELSATDATGATGKTAPAGEVKAAETPEQKRARLLDSPEVKAAAASNTRLQEALRSGDLKAARAALEELERQLAELQRQWPGAGRLLGRMIDTARETRNLLDQGLKLADQVSRLKDGELASFLDKVKAQDPKLVGALLFCCSERDFGRLLDKAGGLVAEQALADVGGLGKLQPAKLGALAASLCNATYTSDADERKLILIAGALEGKGLEAFERGLKAGGCTYDKFLHYVNDYSGEVDRRVALRQLVDVAHDGYDDAKREAAQDLLDKALEPEVDKSGLIEKQQRKAKAREISNSDIGLMDYTNIVKMLYDMLAVDGGQPVYLKDFEVDLLAVILSEADSGDPAQQKARAAFQQLPARDLKLFSLAAFYQYEPKWQAAIQAAVDRMPQEDRDRFADILQGRLSPQDQDRFDKLRGRK